MNTCFRLFLAALLGSACSAASTEDSANVPVFGPDTIGGDRPARVLSPSDYDGLSPLPLVFLLHGYGVNSELQDGLFHLSGRVDEDQFLLVLPEGSLDSRGKTFWNAWPISEDPIDDVAYLLSLLDEMEATWRVDSARVYFTGHSNGGFMSYRMACEASEHITGILNLAGLSPYMDLGNCEAAAPVSYLHVHGTQDSTVPYEGDAEWAGAEEVTAHWIHHNGCDEQAARSGTPMDLTAQVPDDETQVTDWTEGCEGGSQVSIWRMEEASHAPFFNGEWSRALMGWMLKSSKTPSL